jgi:hypothetical protein
MTGVRNRNSYSGDRLGKERNGSVTPYIGNSNSQLVERASELYVALGKTVPSDLQSKPPSVLHSLIINLEKMYGEAHARSQGLG